MSADFEGRIALVTGASGGIGAAVAEVLAERGARLALTARDADTLAAVAGRCERPGTAVPVTVVADVTGDDLEERLGPVVDDLGRLDVLVNSAGSALRAAKLEQLTLDDWRAAVELNLLAAVRLQRRCFDALRRAQGVVVNVGSVVASRATVLGAAYAAAKAGLASLTRSTALEWARHGIRSVCVEPGFVDTDFNRQLKDAGLEDRLLAKIPTRRPIEARTVAELVADVASPRVPDLTGTVVTLDGGWSAKL